MDISRKLKENAMWALLAAALFLVAVVVAFMAGRGSTPAPPPPAKAINPLDLTMVERIERFQPKYLTSKEDVEKALGVAQHTKYGEYDTRYHEFEYTSLPQPELMNLTEWVAGKDKPIFQSYGPFTGPNGQPRFRLTLMFVNDKLNGWVYRGP